MAFRGRKRSGESHGSVGGPVYSIKCSHSVSQRGREGQGVSEGHQGSSATATFGLK